MNINKSIVTILIMVAGFTICQAQEPNLTQFQRTPFLTNPGMIGAVDQPSVIINFRHHNHESGTQYNTSSISAFHPLFIGPHRIGWGVSLLNDQAADFMATRAALAGVGAGIQISKRHLLSLGIQVGYYHQGLGDSNGFSTDQQFINGVYMPHAPTGEHFETESSDYISMSTGLYWTSTDNEGLRRAFAGISIFNLNEPERGFIKEDHVLYTFKGIAGWRLYKNETLSIFPAVRWIANDSYHLWMGGSHVNFKLNHKSSDESTLSFGLWYSDANIGAANVEVNLEKFIVGLSYDVPVGGEWSHQKSNIFEIMFAIKFSKKDLQPSS